MVLIIDFNSKKEIAAYQITKQNKYVHNYDEENQILLTLNEICKTHINQGFII